MELRIDSSKLFTFLLGTAVVAGFAWMWKMNERVAKIESPDSMISRVQTLERLIFPIGVEYEVRKRMEAIGPPAPDPARDNAEDNLRSMIEQRPLEEVINRRGKPIEFKNKTK